MFSQQLQILLDDFSVTPKKLAAETNIDVTLIYRYLNKHVLPNMNHSIVIADYFKCSLDYLFGLSNNCFIEVYKSSMPFSIRLQQLLQKESISKYRFEKDTRFSGQSITDWCFGRKLPTATNFKAIATYLQVSLDCLAGRE